MAESTNDEDGEVIKGGGDERRGRGEESALRLDGSGERKGRR